MSSMATTADGERLSSESYGKKTEFWLSVKPISVDVIRSARELHDSIVEELPDNLKPRIVGTFLDARSQSHVEPPQVQGFVYCTNRTSAIQVLAKIRSDGLMKHTGTTVFLYDAEDETAVDEDVAGASLEDKGKGNDFTGDDINVSDCAVGDEFPGGNVLDLVSCSAREDEEDLLSAEPSDSGSVTSDRGSTISTESTVCSSQEARSFTVIVSDLPSLVRSDNKLYARFNSKCAGIKKAYLVKRKGCGEVVFNTHEEMEACVSKMNGASLFGAENGRVSVRVKTREKQQRKSGKNRNDFQRKDQRQQQQKNQQQQTDEEKQPPQREQNRQQQQQQQRRRQQQRKQPYAQGQLSDYNRGNNYMSQPSDHNRGSNDMQQPSDLCQNQQQRNQRQQKQPRPRQQAAQTRQEYHHQQQRDQQQQKRQPQPLIGQRQLPQLMAQRPQEFNPNLKKNDERPYVIISNLRPNLPMDTVKGIFERDCQGVVEVEKIKEHLGRVYFESADLAAEAVKVMNCGASLDDLTDGRKSSVKLGISASHEMENRELDKYIESMKERQLALLEENTAKLIKIRVAEYRYAGKNRNDFQRKDQRQQQQKNQQQQTDEEKQPPQREQNRQQQQQQQRRRQQQRKQPYAQGQLSDYTRGNNYMSQPSDHNRGSNDMQQPSDLCQNQQQRNQRQQKQPRPRQQAAQTRQEYHHQQQRDQQQQKRQPQPLMGQRQLPQLMAQRPQEFNPNLKKNDERPYVIISNLRPNVPMDTVKRIFERDCQGVVEFEKIKEHLGRVYFESADLAAEAVKVMNGGASLDDLTDGREPSVKLGISASHEMKNRELDEYIESMKERQLALLEENTAKLIKIRNAVAEYRYAGNDGEECLKTYEQKIVELERQREEFERKYKELEEDISSKERRKATSARKLLEKNKRVIERELNRFKASLPIYAKRQEIVETIRGSQIVILIGATGSGKSTQLAQYLADELSPCKGSIVVTQPRKIAAVSLGKRVAEEYGCSVGEEVGYHVGLQQKVSGKTIIKFVTDRILLNEVLKDKKNMGKYSCIVIDEAHERSIYTDLLLAMIKQNLSDYPDLRLIVTSATLNTAVFQRYFENSPIVEVQGRTFPVERIYEKVSPVVYTDRVVEKTVEICRSGEVGDILVFLTQQNEIERTCEKLKKRLDDGREEQVPKILPLHGKLQAEEQEEVFKPTANGERKIVVATNSAETSITIDGIRIVVDSGMVKEPSFDPNRNMITLDVRKVSRSSALQRSGRAGRTAPGKCYCMYTEDEFNEMEIDTRPEILKMHLGMAVLQLLSLGVVDVGSFDFVEAPPPETLARAQENLVLLGAIDNEGKLTEQGRMMLELPTEPKLSKALLEGLNRGCGDKIITVAALMSSGRGVFYRGDTAEKKITCAILKQEFCKTSGDLLSALEVYTLWSKQPVGNQSRWCMENALNAKTLRGTRETVAEIKDALRKLDLRNFEVTSENVEQDIVKSLLTGYSENIAWSLGHERLGYVVVPSNQNTRLHPSSVLSSLGAQPHWVLFQEMRQTSEIFLLNVTPIQFDWLAEVAAHMLTYVDEAEIERKQVKRERMYPLGPTIVKSVIGPRGTTLRQIQDSVMNYTAQSRVCLIECSVEKGLIEIYTPADALDYARTKVNDVMAKRRREILDGDTEVVVSKSIDVGYLKSMVGNDMKTRTILQPGECCKFDVFLKREDDTCEVDPEEVLVTLKKAGHVVHTKIFQNLNNSSRNQYSRSRNQSNSTKWGSVTYSDYEEAKKAKRVIESDQSELPYNAEKITLKPPRVQPQNAGEISGTRVTVTWYPFPSTGRAYITCTDTEAAQRLIYALQNAATSFGNPQVKVSGDVVVNISEGGDELTLRQAIESTRFDAKKAISKITVPSRRKTSEVTRRGTSKVDVEVEKRKVLKFLEMYEKVRVVDKPRVMSCQKVRAYVVFLNLEDAKRAVEELNGKTGRLGARRVYLELEGKSEITCNNRLYNNIKGAVVKIIEEYNGVKYDTQSQSGGKTKITISGNDGEVVQILGKRLADAVKAISVPIDEPVVVRALSGSYGRNQLKRIEKDCGAFIQSSMMGRCLQVTGTPEAKEKALAEVEHLVNELEERRNVEIPLRGSGVPVGAIRRILKEYGKDLKALVEDDDENCQAVLDIHRRVLVISGAKESVEKVQKKVDKLLCDMRNTAHSVNADSEVCPVCTDEIEQPYRLNVCGHSYCSDCVSQYVTLPLESERRNDTLPLMCMHEGCEYPVTKGDFLAFLNQGQVDLLYRISFECFLMGNAKYKPCPSPDCSWVYESTPNAAIFDCPECGARVCRGCGDVAHEFYNTCEENKASKDPVKSDELYKAWVSVANTRQCPQCSVMIEKNGGCVHVHCSRCNAYICWRCGKFFQTSDDCYGHQPYCGR